MGEPSQFQYHQESYQSLGYYILTWRRTFLKVKYVGCFDLLRPGRGQGCHLRVQRGLLPPPSPPFRHRVQNPKTGIWKYDLEDGRIESIIILSENRDEVHGGVAEDGDATQSPLLHCPCKKLSASWQGFTNQRIVCAGHTQWCSTVTGRPAGAVAAAWCGCGACMALLTGRSNLRLWRLSSRDLPIDVLF